MASNVDNALHSTDDDLHGLGVKGLKDKLDDKVFSLGTDHNVGYDDHPGSPLSGELSHSGLLDPDDGSLKHLMLTLD